MEEWIIYKMVESESLVKEYFVVLEGNCPLEIISIKFYKEGNLLECAVLVQKLLKFLNMRRKM